MPTAKIAKLQMLLMISSVSCDDSASKKLLLQRLIARAISVFTTRQIRNPVDRIQAKSRDLPRQYPRASRVKREIKNTLSNCFHLLNTNASMRLCIKRRRALTRSATPSTLGFKVKMSSVTPNPRGSPEHSRLTVALQILEQNEFKFTGCCSQRQYLRVAYPEVSHRYRK